MTPQEKLKSIKESDADNKELNVDSIYKIKDVRWLIARVEQLEKVLEGISKTSDFACINAADALDTGPKPE